MRPIERGVREHSRRDILKAAALAGFSVSAGCAARGTLPPAAPPSTAGILDPSAARLAPVLASPDRVIRTVAGLRPFRPSGFVVRSEWIGGKTVIHNYGHGGAGITLSWGTSHLALEHALRTGHRDFAVLGCGVMGLSTARLLQQRGLSVTIYTKDVPPHTTSNIAGGLWMPVTVFDSARTSPEFAAQFERACRISHREFQNLAGDTYGVRWMPIYALGTRSISLFTADGPFRRMLDLFPGATDLSVGQHPFSAPYASRAWIMLIEPAIYLNALLRDFQMSGGSIVVRELNEVQEVLTLREPVIVNCTGLGARALFDDAELTPIKGQLSFLVPQPEVNYCTLGPEGMYMFPRKDGILLGGTHERGEWSLEPDREAAGRILQANREVFEGMKIRTN